MILKPITEEKQEGRGWKLELNGEPVEHVCSLQLYNSSFGTLEYGETPAGYDSWCFEEVGGGGGVIVPYIVDQGWLFVGLVCQDRYTMGGKVWNLPRGFLGEGESHFEAAKREGSEELRFNLADRFSELPGSPTNWNSTFLVTLGNDRGVRFYALEVKSSEVEMAEKDGSVYKFRDDVLRPVSRVGELILGSKFVSYVEALQTRDMFTVAGVGRLLSTVMSKLR